MTLSLNRSIMERETTTFTADGHNLQLCRTAIDPRWGKDARAWEVRDNNTGDVVGKITTRDGMKFTPHLMGGAVLPWGRSLMGVVYVIGRYIAPKEGAL